MASCSTTSTACPDDRRQLGPAGDPVRRAGSGARGGSHRRGVLGEPVGGQLRRGRGTGRPGQSPIASDAFDDLIREARVIIEPVTAEQALLARHAYRTYGHGSGSPARLNLGDCFAYALAKAAGEPLLFKGDAFGHTDVEVAALR
jgi:uncharacterized protein with PIN domain